MRAGVIILIVVALTACETQLRIDVPLEPRKAVINAIFLSDSVWTVGISTSSPIESNIIIHVADPEVILTDEIGQQIPLIKDDLNPYNLSNLMPWHPSVGVDTYRATSKPKPGMTYRIELRSSNMPTAFATARAPTAIELIDARLDTSALGGGFQGNVEHIPVPLEFTFDDPAGQADYYYALMMEVREYSYWDPNAGDTIRGQSPQLIEVVATYSDSEFFDFSDQFNAIPDETFDGKRHTMKMYALYPNYMSSGKLVSRRLYLDHSGEDYYRYFRSMRLQEEARINPFAEPVQVFSNVQGGMGAFVGRTTSYWEFIK